MTDPELFSTIEEKLFTAVVGDVLDVMGHRHQFLPIEIKPLVGGTKIVGRAMTVLEADYPAGGTHGLLSDAPFGVMFEALDDLKTGEIYIATGASLDFALWGGLMSTRAQHLAAAGAILDGCLPDAGEIRALEFPVFSRGVYAQHQGVRGKVLDYRIPLRIGETDIESGDLIFADDEGVRVIPQSVEAEAVEKAIEKAKTENDLAIAIKNGMSAVGAFEKSGIM